jgi:hypothetical protein
MKDADWSFVDEGDECTRCGGDGFEECDDFIQCMRSYHIGDEHECSACGGSGLAEDQTVW